MSATAQSPGKTSIGQGSVHWTSEMSEMKSELESSGKELVAETISYKVKHKKAILRCGIHHSSIPTATTCTFSFIAVKQLSQSSLCLPSRGPFTTN